MRIVSLSAEFSVLAAAATMTQPNFAREQELAQVGEETGQISGCQAGCEGDFSRDGNADQGDIDAIVDYIAGGPCP